MAGLGRLPICESRRKLACADFHRLVRSTLTVTPPPTVWCFTNVEIGADRLTTRFASVKPDARQLKPAPKQVSTWYYNGIAMSAFLVVSLIASFLLVISGTELSATVLSCFLVMAFIGASWANVGLGPKIGWDRGGLPIVLLVTSVATVFYTLVALLIGGCIYIGVGLALPN